MLEVHLRNLRGRAFRKVNKESNRISEENGCLKVCSGFLREKDIKDFKGFLS